MKARHLDPRMVHASGGLDPHYEVDHHLVTTLCGAIYLFIGMFTIYVSYIRIADPYDTIDMAIIRNTARDSSVGGRHEQCKKNTRQLWLQKICKQLNLTHKASNASFVVNDKHKVLYCPISGVARSAFIKVMTQTSDKVGNVTVKVKPDQVETHQAREITHKVQKYFKFVVVRHPFERLLAIYDTYRGDIAMAYARKLTSQAVQRYGAELRTDNKGRQFMSLQQFLRLLATDVNFTQPLWTPLSSCDPCSISYDKIIRLETVTADADVIRDRLKAPGGHRPALGPIHGVPHPRARWREVLAVFRSLDPEIIRGLGVRYRLDFALYGYTWSDDTGPGCHITSADGTCC